jgi:hypothetical protein
MKYLKVFLILFITVQSVQASRYYSSEYGRFIERDPIGYVDGMSLYQGYFAQHQGVDPSGLHFFGLKHNFSTGEPLNIPEFGPTNTTMSTFYTSMVYNYLVGHKDSIDVNGYGAMKKSWLSDSLIQEHIAADKATIRKYMKQAYLLRLYDKSACDKGEMDVEITLSNDNDAGTWWTQAGANGRGGRQMSNMTTGNDWILSDMYILGRSTVKRTWKGKVAVFCVCCISGNHQGRTRLAGLSYNGNLNLSVTDTITNPGDRGGIDAEGHEWGTGKSFDINFEMSLDASGSIWLDDPCN